MNQNSLALVYFLWFQECHNTFSLSPDNQLKEPKSFLIYSVRYCLEGTLYAIYLGACVWYMRKENKSRL